MSIIARQSTARTFMVGPVLDADGVAVTNGVIADFKISKNGAAPAAFDGSATLTHRHTGFYSLAATANDLDTVGQAQVTIDDTVNSCPMTEITVIEEAVYDALYAASATGRLPADLTHIGGVVLASATLTLGALAVTGTTVLTGRLTVTGGAEFGNTSLADAAIRIKNNTASFSALSIEAQAVDGAAVNISTGGTLGVALNINAGYGILLQQTSDDGYGIFASGGTGIRLEPALNKNALELLATGTGKAIATTGDSDLSVTVDLDAIIADLNLIIELLRSAQGSNSLLLR